ncbi:hypothetical protein ASC77_18785 [Nocardioides sp. Root1257]|uniref:DUF3732 domain-containing protein n=1 Tax=unclassified Nocardioides TaxID=2615069 RepID=UPI00070071D0|nr:MULTISPECIES: DUF3732 domain-containing protein [unclassified Nocardioides]KQW45957.1 hypothetical protein ASC77_18785 [Nocardioides sp. Root1257]KRC43221.1 hypothetical protein ASE24_19750 [Nocardioides sp. Root224]
MQILEIALYSNDGEKRSILLRPGELNVITGASLKGKSSLIGIIRYLLGSGSPHAPALIRKAVDWYGLLAEIDGQRFFIGRPRVGANQTTNQAMLLPDADETPRAADLGVNTTSEAVRTFLGELLGIEANENVPDTTQSRRPLAATFVHSLYYCFLEQGEIANPRSLFHRQSRDWQPQTIRDTLPYFMGAQGRREMELRDEIRRLRRQVRDLERQVGELTAFRQQEERVAGALVAQARDYGLLDTNPQPGSSIVEQLRLAVSIDTPSTPTPVSAPEDEYERLIDESARLREAIRERAAQIRGLERFAEVNVGYEIESTEQNSRLLSLGLLPTGAAHNCPVCGHDASDQADEMKSQLTEALEVSEQRVSSAARDKQRIQKAISELESGLDGDRLAYEQSLEAIRTIDSLRATESTRARRLEMRSYVAGRISLFLETRDVAQDMDIDVLRGQIRALKARITDLEEQVDGDAVRSRTVALMTQVSRRMAELARTLGLEHADTGVRLDPQRLTVVADLPSGPAYMSENEIGSGMNWVGYHLTAYLALQEYFIDHQRPVPSFIVFDQPTQVFFPEETPRDTEIGDLEVGDQDRARQLFRLMRDVVEEANGRLQVIVLDHADFSDDWFREAVVERWRGSEALVPAHWLSDVRDEPEDELDLSDTDDN